MYKQAILVNTDLKMGKGKIAGQVAHGEFFYGIFIHNIIRKFGLITPLTLDEKESLKIYRGWIKDHLMPKIIFKVTEEELIQISKRLTKNAVWNKIVVDMGFTQIPKDSKTCLIVEPLDEEDHNLFFENLKLL